VRLLVISEEWSSDCRRDVPALARLAEARAAVDEILCALHERIVTTPLT
jgi:hypothetical protein